MIVRVTWKRALATALAVAALGFAVAWSGAIHIGASTGHWKITDWFLHWVMRNTVRTYAVLTVDEPASDESGIVSAAGHYASNCAVCHGAPGEAASPTMQTATPHAPDLRITVPTYSDAELFWIIKHGIKFTGMPAWPALEREDEVRRMVAFVRRLPAMSEEEYRTLAYGPEGRLAAARPLTVEDAVAECDRCHAQSGREQPDIPIIAGQKPRYLRDTLERYAAGERESGVMSAAAARVDEQLRRELAEHYAAREGLEERAVVEQRLGDVRDSPADQPTDATADATGVQVAQRAAQVVAFGLPERDVPPCSECHSPGKRADYPILAGQKAEYLAARLRRWRSGAPLIEARRPDEPMPVIARRLPEELIEPLAQYFSER